MNMNDLLEVIKGLSFSNGFYGRLYNAILELEDNAFEELKELWEGKNFSDDLDFIMYLES